MFHFQSPDSFLTDSLIYSTIDSFQLTESHESGPGYHVEGPINAIYTEILLSLLCQEDTNLWPFFGLFREKLKYIALSVTWD